MKNILIALSLFAGLIGCTQQQKEVTNNTVEEPKKETSISIKAASADSVIEMNGISQPGKINLKPSTPGERTLANKNPETEKKQAMLSYNEGIKLYKEGDMQGALDKFKIALKAVPTDSRINHYVGRIYYDMGQKDLAISYYEDAVRYNIDDSVSILGIGQIYFDKGDFVKAMEYYNMSLDVAPGYGLAYYNRGTLLGMQNKYPEALEDLNKSIQYDATNPNAFLNRGLAYYYLKAMNSACADWQKAADMGLQKGVDAVNLYCK